MGKITAFYDETSNELINFLNLRFGLVERVGEYSQQND